MTGTRSSDRILSQLYFVHHLSRMQYDMPIYSLVLVELVRQLLLVYLPNESIAKIYKMVILVTNAVIVSHSKMKICSIVLRSMVHQITELKMFVTSSKRLDSNQINENIKSILSMKCICSHLEHLMLC